MPARRSLLRAMAALPAGKVAAVAAQKEATALAQVGDRYHNSDYIRAALARTLVKDLGITTDFTDEVSLLNAGNPAAYRLLIKFRDGMIWPDGYPEERAHASESPVSRPAAKDVPWITPTQCKAVNGFVSKGGGVLFYHNVTYISPYNRDFRDVLGAVAGDEQHFLTYDKHPKTVLLRSVNEKGLTYQTYRDSCEAGWAFDYGKGRVCYLAPGHTISALWNR